MAPVFSKEAILQGSVDHLCLVCGDYLRTHHDIATHVSQSEHRETLERTDYVGKYRSDRVRKVKKLYFCELCNVLLTTITKVGLHVEEPGHNQNKTARVITREGDTVAVGDDIAIHEDVWHGLVDNSCTVCNVEFENKDFHKIETTHVINLIQSKVSEVNNNIYRKVDDSTFHCLTCNKVVANINAHIDQTTHKDLWLKCLKVKSSKPQSVNTDDSIDGKKKGSNVVNDQNEDGDFPDKIIETTVDYCDAKFDEHVCEALEAENYITSIDGRTSCTLCNCVIAPLQVNIHLESVHHQMIVKMHQERGDKLRASANVTQDENELALAMLDLAPKFQKNHININLETCTAVCEKCSKTLEYNSKYIEKHIEEHGITVPKRSVDKGAPILSKIDDCEHKDSAKLCSNPLFQNHEDANEENCETKRTDQTEQENEGSKDIQKASEEHGLIYYFGSNKVHCPQCNKRIPSSIKNINEHVSGTVHKSNKLSNSTVNLKEKEVKKKVTPRRCTLPRVPSVKFIMMLASAENMFFEDIVVNRKYCVSKESFVLLKKNSQSSIRCYACEVEVQLTEHSIDRHLTTKRHMRVLKEVPVVIHRDSEFIREVRSGSFHCGFCNNVETSWELMEDHLISSTHKENKALANWRLRLHLQNIEEQTLEHVLHREFLRVLSIIFDGMT